MSAPTGEMRVYFSNQDKHGLIVNVDVTKKGDVYIGDAHLPGVQLLKQSWHASGKGHVHTPAGRLLHTPKESPSNIPKPRRLWGSAPDLALLDWTYRPQERPRRVNVRVDVALFKKAPSWTIDIWALPSTTEIPQVLASYDIVSQHAVMEWTSPAVLAVVWTMRPEAWASLERSIRGAR